MSQQYFSSFDFVRKHLKIKHEILLIMLIKFILIYTLWFFCFSHPIDKKELPQHIASHIFNLTSDNYHD